MLLNTFLTHISGYQNVTVLLSTYLIKVNISLLQAMEAHRVGEVKAPTLLRQTTNRWRQGCQPYAPAALYPQISLFIKISWYSFLLEAESTPGP
jgi:hypothetical protein